MLGHRLLLAVALALTSLVGCAEKTQAQVFVDHWADELGAIADPTDAVASPSQYHPDRVLVRKDGNYVREFGSSQWVIARPEWACEGGGGFDATVFVDSRGDVHYQIGYHFCGGDLFGQAMGALEATNLADFYAELDSIEGLELRSR